MNLLLYTDFTMPLHFHFYHANYKLFSKFCLFQILRCSGTYFVYFKSQKELNYNIFVNPNILGPVRLVHSNLRTYQISFFLLYLFCSWTADCDAGQVFVGMESKSW